MTPHELKAALSRQIDQASGLIGDELSQERAELFERYMGEPYGDEVEDRSRVVSTDVSDTVESIMPELMEIFTAGEKIVSFEPEGPEDEEAAEQETDTVNYVFHRQNDGFMVLYNFVKDGLIAKNGYIKRYWSEREKVTTEDYEGLNEYEWASMLASWQQKGWQVEVEKFEQRPTMMPEGQGEMAMLGDTSVEIDASVKLSRTDERMIVESVPPEEVLVSPRWNKINLDDCPFVAHRRVMLVSDLIEMGYDAEQVKSLPDADDDEFSEERIERFSTRGSGEYDESESMDDSTREVLVHECYVRVDYDEDGRAELRRVMVGGSGYEILRKDGEDDNEEVEVQPFSIWTPVPIPHRHYGRSIAELVQDLQRVKTVLWRQMLDNVYLTNNPTREIAQDGVIEGVTLSDLLHDRPGKVLRTGMPGMYQEHSPPQFMHNLMPAIEYVDSVRENRTGVTRYNQGLDANTLNKTATGIDKIMSSSMRKLALYARVCAETGLRHLFRGIHGDLRRNASKEMTIRLRGKYVPVDPRSWAERSDLTVSVGIGSSDKQLRMAFLERIITEIKEHLIHGSPLASPAHLFNAYERYVVNAGFKNPEEFFANPLNQEQQPPQQQSQGDPQAQAYMQAEMAKVQQREQADQRDDQLEMYKLRLEDDRERDKLNIDAALKLVEINAKNGTAVTIEQIKAAALSASQANQPPK